MTERELLERVARADEQALEALYTSFYPRLGRFLLRLTRDRGLVEEVINDVFLVVWQSAGSFRGASSPSTWIMGIAYKKMLKALRRERPVPLVDSVTSAVESQGELQSAIASLPPAQKAVVVLTYEFGYSYREIGAILKCRENTVKTRMFHARKRLRAMLEA